MTRKPNGFQKVLHRILMMPLSLHSLPQSPSYRSGNIEIHKGKIYDL